jgi:hypothetical protein
MTWLKTAGILMAALVAGCTPGPSRRAVLSSADQLIQTGRADSAVRQLQETRVDHPESDAILFEIARGQYAVAQRLQGEGQGREAERTMRTAHGNFLRVVEGGDVELGASAGFNAATTLLALDATIEGAERYPERVENLEEAVATLDTLLSAEPGFHEASRNLELARYRLALLLQDPPGAEEEEEASEDEPEAPPSAVDSVTTQIPRARAEVVDGSTIVLHLPAREEAVP